MKRCNIEDFFGNKSAGKRVKQNDMTVNADVGVVRNDDNGSELQDANDVSVNVEDVEVLQDNAADDVLGVPSEDITDVKTLVGPPDISNSPSEKPTQPLLRNFPGHLIGGVVRRFNPYMYRVYNWIEYSKVNDAVYCHHCRHFGRASSRKDNFTSSGFRAWNRATGSDCKTNAFMKHKNSDEVSTCTVGLLLPDM